MACIFNTVSLDLTAAMTDSFDGRGAYSRGGAYWRIYGIWIVWYYLFGSDIALSGQNSKFEQLMVNMLDHRDKLMEQIQEKDRKLEECHQLMKDSDKEKELLRRQMELQLQPVPQVCELVFLEI